jgi:hypothetical protein
MHITSDKEELVDFLLGGSVEYAYRVNEELVKKNEEQRLRLDSEDLSDFEEYQLRFAEIEAEYLLTEYDKIAVSPDEKVYGIKGGNNILLMDGNGETKMHIDSMHFKGK